MLIRMGKRHKKHQKREVMYNFSRELGTLSTEHEMGQMLKQRRRDLRDSKGMTKGGTRQLIASVPAEAWWKEQHENPGRLRDDKALKKWVKEQGFNIARKDGI